MNSRTLARSLLLVVAIAVAGAGARGRAQAPQVPPPAQPPQAQSAQAPAPPAFRLSTTLVEVDATVTDKNGSFVDSLTLTDFELLDEGVPQQIQVLFRVAGSKVTTLAPLPLAATDAAGGAANAGVPASPDQAQLVQSKPPQRVYILFFDQEHLDQNSFTRVQQSAETFLAAKFQEGDVGGVLMGSTMVGNRLTADRQTLVAAVKTATLNPGQTILRNELALYPRMAAAEAMRIALFDDQRILNQVADRAAREGPETSGRNSPDLRPMIMEKSRQIVSQMQRSTATTLKAMQGLLTGLARVPGRKSVLFMTEGFFFEESWADLRILVGQAARANVRIYTIDALGLRRGSDGTELSSMNPLETTGQVPLGAYNTTEEGPNMLANDTGGYVIRKTNDFAAAMTEIARDAGSYYVLGFSPPESALTGRFRDITVKVKRSGLKVRARRGYLAAKAGGAVRPAAEIGAPAAAEMPVPPPVRPVDAPKAAAENPPPAPAEAAAGLSAPLPTIAIPLRPDTNSRVRDLADRRSASGEAKTLATKGWERYGVGDLEGAETFLAQAVAQPGAAPWVSYALGFAELGLRKPDKAAESWERVRAAVPAFTPVYLDLTDAYLQMGNPARAIDVLRAAEQKWPKDIEILNALGTVQVRRGSSEDAIATFERAIAADPKDSLAYLNAAKTYELRYYQLRRFSRPQSRWMDDPQLRQKAIENYETYLKLGGPYEADARTALDRLRSDK
jgi:VWFA-related protein